MIEKEDITELLPYFQTHPKSVNLLKFIPDVSVLKEKLLQYFAFSLDDHFDVAAVELIPTQKFTFRLPTQIHLIFKHKKTNKLHISDLRYLPSADYIVICGELMALTVPEE